MCSPICDSECQRVNHCAGGYTKCTCCGAIHIDCDMIHYKGDLICDKCYDDYFDALKEEEDDE